MTQVKALKIDKESCDDSVRETLNHESCRSQTNLIQDRILSRRQSILQRTGIQPVSFDLIRELRSNEGRHA
jgi:hypothetical protein